MNPFPLAALVGAFSVLGAVPAPAPMPTGFKERMCLAIWHAEGGTKAKVPYGILSMKVRSKEHARQITLRSIENGWKRWQDAGRPGDFLTHFGLRWSPPHLHPKNRHWADNVRKRM